MTLFMSMTLTEIYKGNRLGTVSSLWVQCWKQACYKKFIWL